MSKNTKRISKKFLYSLVAGVCMYYAITFHNFLMPKVALGMLGSLFGITILASGVAIIKDRNLFIKKVKKFFDIKQESSKDITLEKTNIIKYTGTLNDIDLENNSIIEYTSTPYINDRVQAVDKAVDDKGKIVYVDHLTPVLEEQFQGMPQLDNIITIRNQFAELEQRMLVEEDFEERRKLKNELTALSFELQDILTDELIDDNKAKDLESLYKVKQTINRRQSEVNNKPDSNTKQLFCQKRRILSKRKAS